MNGRQVAQVGLGLIGVLTLVNALAGLVEVAAVVVGSRQPFGMFVITGMPMLLLGGISYVLVFNSGALVAAISSESEAAATPGVPDLARVLVVLLGVYILEQTIPSTVTVAISLRAMSQFGGASRATVTGRVIGVGIQIAIAVFLIGRPDRLLDFMRRPAVTEVE